MRRDARLRTMIIVSALTAALTITGCGVLPSTLVARVPTSGPIEEGEQVTTEGDGQFVRVIARGPRDDMSPTEVVRGFLDASASFEGDHAVAREYLTSEASARWRPGSGVTVYEGIGSLSGAGPQVRLDATQAGSISSIGHYAVAPAGTALRGQYELRRVDGQWRISSLPNGLILSVADVDRSFRSHSVYFFDPSFTTLVPDDRLLPVTGATLATTLVRDLIDGPSTWLSPAVRNAFPTDVHLAVDSVTIDTGIALVQLNANALLTTDDVRRAMSQQLVWTLRQVPEVQAIAITAGGQRLTVPGSVYPQPRDSWPTFDPDAMPTGAAGYYIQHGRAQRIAQDGSTHAVFDASEGEITKLTELAISLDSRSIAGLDDAGQLRWGRLTGTGALAAVGDRDALRAPVFDRSGSVWVLDEAWQPLAFDADGREVAITVEGLEPDSTIRRMAPSRDGTRVALVVQQGSTSTVLVGRIVRSALDEEIRIQAPIRVESVLSTVIDVAWAGSESIAVIASVGAAAPGVYSVDLARGLAAPVGAPTIPVAVAAAPGKSMLVAQEDGTVYRLQSGQWLAVGNGTRPTYPG